MRTSIGAVALAGALAFLAGCGGTDEPTESARNDAPADSPADATAASTDPDLAVGPTTYGDVLVDGDGMTLYLFTEDPEGESVCVDDCPAAWPPLVTDGEPTAGDGVDRDLLSTITRPDGSTQVTYRGAPLYTWAADQEPGDATGQGVQDAWFVVAPDGSAVMDVDGSGAGPDEPAADDGPTDGPNY